ncbi:acyltransferase family protein [Kocuria palustris]|uniref:acyltransferase family protein n=1 Tax=Kocuria palustris TaxID=71999 RepID=UPI0011A27247|nr:acyltransferase family protein [Kocuria palustris]
MSSALAPSRPTAAAPPASRAPHFPVLDMVRAAAIVLVVAYHLAPATVPSGFLGVDLFFVLSGFLITRGLLGRIARERPGAQDGSRGVGGFLREFYLKRLRRLFPAFAVMLVTVCSLALAAPPDARVMLGRQVAGALTSTANWVQLATGATYFDDGAPQLLKHMWSLAVEEQFYLVWPLVLLLLAGAFRRGSRPRLSLPVAAARFALAGAVSSAVAMAVVLLLTGDHDQAHLNTLTHAGGLLLGAFVAAMPRSGPAVSAAGRRAPVLIALAVMLAGLVVLRDTSPLPQLGGIFVFTLAAAVVVRWGTTGAAAEARPPELLMAPVRWLAQRSYALYLWHWPLIVLVQAWLPDRSGGAIEPGLFWARAGLVIGGSALAAELSFRWVETPVLRRGFRGALGELRRRGRGLLIAGVVSAALLVALTGYAVATAPTQTQQQQRLEALQHDLEDASADSSAENGDRSPDPVPGESAEPAPGPGAQGADDHGAPADEAQDGVVVIGDSVTVAASPEVLEAHPGAVIDAEVGQQMSTAEGTVRTLASQDRLKRTVVLALGTNGSFTEDELDAAVRAAGPGHRFVLVTPYGDRPWIPGAAQVMRDYAAAHPDSVRVAAWDEAAEDVPDMAPDGVHPGRQGAEVWAETVDAAIHGFDG